jgi:hypothetical protein
MAMALTIYLIRRGALETVSDHKAQFHEEVEGIVERSTADVKVHIFDKFLAKLLQRKVTMHTIYRSKDSVALRGLAMMIHLKIVVQDAFCVTDHTFLTRNSHSKPVDFLKTAQRYT